MAKQAKVGRKNRMKWNTFNYYFSIGYLKTKSINIDIKYRNSPEASSDVKNSPPIFDPRTPLLTHC